MSHSPSKHYVNLLKAGGLISRILIGIKESCWPAFMSLHNALVTNVTSHDFLILISSLIAGLRKLLCLEEIINLHITECLTIHARTGVASLCARVPPGSAGSRGTGCPTRRTAASGRPKGAQPSQESQVRMVRILARVVT